MECARTRFASRCGGKRSIQPHLCVAFFKRCTKMRSNRLSAATAARKPHAARTPCEHQKMVFAWRAKCAVCEPLWRRTIDSTAY
eukprot:8053483-Lingulodinium_polyedra.AAC.1